MRKLKNNNKASAVPLILFFVTIITCGAFYTLLFIKIGYPTFRDFIPEGDVKTVIMMLMYAIPLFLIIVGILATFKAALKQTIYTGGY